jgi:hypothetical protein
MSSLLEALHQQSRRMHRRKVVLIRTPRIPIDIVEQEGEEHPLELELEIRW